MENINLDTIYDVVERLENNGYVVGAITSKYTGEIMDIENCNGEDMLAVDTFGVCSVEVYEAHGFEFDLDVLNREGHVTWLSLSDLLQTK